MHTTVKEESQWCWGKIIIFKNNHSSSDVQVEYKENTNYHPIVGVKWEQGGGMHREETRRRLQKAGA